MNYKPQENVTRNREISYIVETPLNVNKLITKLITTTVYLFQFIPIYSISKDLSVYFAIDNTDLKIDTTVDETNSMEQELLCIKKRNFRSSTTRIF